MQEPGHGITVRVDDVKNLVEKAYRWSVEKSRELASFIASAPTLFAYTGLGVVPAKIASNIITVLSQKEGYAAMESQRIIYHVAPYSESKYNVVFFSSSSWERNQIARAYDTLRIMGVMGRYIIPNSDDPILSQKIGEEERIVVPEEEHILTYTSILAAESSLTAVKLMIGEESPRTKRLIREFETIVESVNEIAAAYKHTIEELESIGSSEAVIYYTPLMEAPAQAIAYIGNKKGGKFYPAPLQVMLYHEPHGKPVILSTSVEEALAKEAYFRAKMIGLSPVSIVFNTDPLSAQVYGVILSLLLQSV